MAGWGEPPERSAGGPDRPQPGWEQQPHVPPPGQQYPGQQPYPGGPQPPYGGQQPPHGGQQPPYPGGGPQQPPGWPPNYGGPSGGWSDPAMGTPPPRKKRTGLLIGLISAGVVVVLIIVAGVYAVSTGVFSTRHTITLANSAGGLKRDRKLEAEHGLNGSDVAKSKRALRKLVGTNVDELKIAPYAPPGGSGGDSSKDTVFAGVTAKDGKHFDPQRTVDRMRADVRKNKAKALTANIRLRAVSPGPLGGKAMCQTVSEYGAGSATCLWVDEDTFGEIIQASGTQVPSLTGAASRMRAMRGDLEK